MSKIEAKRYLFIRCLHTNSFLPPSLENLSIPHTSSKKSRNIGDPFRFQRFNGYDEYASSSYSTFLIRFYLRYLFTQGLQNIGQKRLRYPHDVLPTNLNLPEATASKCMTGGTCPWPQEPPRPPTPPRFGEGRSSPG